MQKIAFCSMNDGKIMRTVPKRIKATWVLY